MPVGQVVLFSSGVGYFQREESVEGNARVDLSFPVSDINDLAVGPIGEKAGNSRFSHVSSAQLGPERRMAIAYLPGSKPCGYLVPLAG
jgi:hypothetical protein